jgi:hypothetical protein
VSETSDAPPGEPPAYIIGDNGASAEGDLHGCFNEADQLSGANALRTTDFMASRIDDFGTPKAYNHYAVGWAHAMCTPWTKQVASHWGGTRNAAGTHQVRMEFTYDGGGLGKGGSVTLFIDGDQVGEGRVEATVPMVFSADETADVGSDLASPVADDYPPGATGFTGTINWVQLDIGADDHDHLISPDERYRIAMARQ